MTVTTGGTGYLGASDGWGAYGGGGYLIIDGGTYVAFTGLVATRDASVGTISIIGGASFQVETVNPADFNSIDTNQNGGTGTINVGGVGTTVSVIGAGNSAIRVGYTGTGNFNAYGGASVYAFSLDVGGSGNGGGNSGTLTIDGPGTTFRLSGDFGAFYDFDTVLRPTSVQTRRSVRATTRPEPSPSRMALR